MINKVRVQPNLNKFLKKCLEYGVRVGLSSWFRKDEDDLRMKLDSPEKLGKAWYPYFVNDLPEAIWSGWHTDKSKQWMRTSIELLKAQYPGIPFTFSFTGEVNQDTLAKGAFEMLDFLEPHIWMTSYNNGEFYNEVGLCDGIDGQVIFGGGIELLMVFRYF